MRATKMEAVREGQSSNVSRRTLLKWGAAGTVASVGGWIGWGLVDEANEQSSPRAMQPRPADNLAAAFGVVTHLHFREAAYGQSERVVEQLADLGVRHIRSRLAAMPPVRAAFVQLSANGTRVQGVCGAFGDPQTMRQVMDEVTKSYDDPVAVFSAFEGINEPNNNGVPWVDETRAKTKDLFEERHSHGLDEITIVGPALARVSAGGVEGADTQAQSATLGDLTPWIEQGNIHVYPRGQSPSADLDEFISWQRQVCGEKPIYNTEGGFFTAINYRGGSNPASEDAVRQYAPRLVMESWIRGIQRFFLYELLDDPDESKSHRESNFGMVKVSGLRTGDAWTPKPHYLAMKNFLTILSDPGPVHTLSALTYGIDDAGPEVRTTLVQKRDGSHYLCLWRDVAVYDPVSRESIAVAPRTIRVALQDAAVVSEYRPATQAMPVATHRQVRSFPVSMAGELHICKIAVLPPPQARPAVQVTG